jgi:hypothetical protein
MAEYASRSGRSGARFSVAVRLSVMSDEEVVVVVAMELFPRREREQEVEELFVKVVT